MGKKETIEPRCMDQHVDYDTNLGCYCQLRKDHRGKHYYKYEVDW